MGMAASQVRFLTLQDRKSTIGMRLGILSNRKMALTRDMNKAAQAYNDAYTETKLQWYDSINGSYTDITYNAMMTPNAGNAYTPYLITDRNTGRVILDGNTQVAQLLGATPQNTDSYWDKQVDGVYVSQFHPVSGSSALSGTMPYHMERLTQSTTAGYIPGTVSYDETTMAPYIIEQMMGVEGFDREKMVYEAVKNANLTDGGWRALCHSDIMDLMTVGIGSSNGKALASTTTSRLPVWEVYQDQTYCNTAGLPNYLNYGAVCCAYDVYTGEYGYKYEHEDSESWDQEANWYSNPSNYTVDQYNIYLDASGNAHNLTGNTYWSTLYNNGAVILGEYDYNDAGGGRYKSGYDSGSPFGADYSNSLSKLMGLKGISNSDIPACNLYKWVHKFVSDVNGRRLLKYDMSDYIDTISMATTRHFRDTYYDAGHDDKNVSSRIQNYITKKPDDIHVALNSYTGDAGDWYISLGSVQKSVWAQREQYETTLYAGNSAAEGNKLGDTNIASVLARQANSTTSAVLYSGDHARYNMSKNLVHTGADYVAAISIKNVIDVALYYIGICQDKLKANQPISTTNDGEDLYSIAKETFNYADYNNDNNPKYSDPSNFTEGEMDTFVQGETSVASVYSIRSNLKMLKEKIDHCQGLENNPTANNVNSLGCYNVLLEYLSNLIANGNVNDNQLIGLANMNAWICEALKQDYLLTAVNDDGTVTNEGVDKINEYLTNIADLYEIMTGSDDAFSEDNWNATQTNHGNIFYYDGPQTVNGVTTNIPYYRREQLFSQSSERKGASKHLDIEGQLTVPQFNQFKFYVNLVKECLARGWNRQDNVDNNTVTLQMQNSRWLINDNVAKCSSRVFEVANKDAREEALSKYETLQSELKIKEERIDIQMDKLETEQNAINTELDSLKSIIKDNIDSTFKIFS